MQQLLSVYYTPSAWKKQAVTDRKVKKGQTFFVFSMTAREDNDIRARARLARASGAHPAPPARLPHLAKAAGVDGASESRQEIQQEVTGGILPAVVDFRHDLIGVPLF